MTRLKYKSTLLPLYHIVGYWEDGKIILKRIFCKQVVTIWTPLNWRQEPMWYYGVGDTDSLGSSVLQDSWYELNINVHSRKVNVTRSGYRCQWGVPNYWLDHTRRALEDLSDTNYDLLSLSRVWRATKHCACTWNGGGNWTWQHRTNETRTPIRSEHLYSTSLWVVV
jgi:hypothetical protein